MYQKYRLVIKDVDFFAGEYQNSKASTCSLKSTGFLWRFGRLRWLDNAYNCIWSICRKLEGCPFLSNINFIEWAGSMAGGCQLSVQIYRVESWNASYNILLGFNVDSFIKYYKLGNVLTWFSLIISPYRTSSPNSSRGNLIHALTPSPIPTTRCHKSRTRPVSLYRPPTKPWDCCNPSLNPSLTIASPLQFLSPTGLATPVNLSTILFR